MKKIIYLFLIIPLLFSSCTKEQGCIDAQATNYNIDAEEDDGSCLYAGNIVFYLEYNIPEILDANNINYVYFEIGDALSNSTNLNWTQVPGSISTTWTGWIISPFDCSGDFKTVAHSWEMSSSINESVPNFRKRF